jgi:hypothetical protein
MSDELFQKLMKISLYLVLAFALIWITGLGPLAAAALGGIVNLILGILGFMTSIWGIYILIVVIRSYYSSRS